MSEAKFTKNMMIGEPTDNAPFCIDGVCNVDGMDFEVCSVWGVNNDSIGCEQSRANAHLIACAPEMYEEIETDVNTLSDFIKTLKPYSNDWLFYSNELKRKAQLLAKARGEQ